MVKWLLEDGFDDNIDKLEKEIRNQGFESCKLERKDFYDSIAISKLFDKHACVIYYGSLGVCYTINRHTSWTPGTYANFEALKCSIYYPIFGDFLLNEDYVIIPHADLYRKKDQLYNFFGKFDKIFMRPDKGTKSFTGQCVYYNDFDSVIDKDSMNTDLCVISSPKEIYDEWRFLIVDNNVITGSKYSSDIKDDQDYFSASEFVSKLLNSIKFCPDRAWTLDICKTPVGYKVIEANSFSCAGLYNMDLKKVVSEVSRVALEDTTLINDYFGILTT